MAHQLTGSIDRVVRDATKPLLRGSHGLDHESRAQWREFQHELRHAGRDGFHQSFQGGVFDAQGFVERTTQALESFAAVVAAMIGPDPSTPTPEEAGDTGTKPVPAPTEEPDVSLAFQTSPTVSGRVDLLA